MTILSLDFTPPLHSLYSRANCSLLSSDSVLCVSIDTGVESVQFYLVVVQDDRVSHDSIIIPSWILKTWIVAEKGNKIWNMLREGVRVEFEVKENNARVWESDGWSLKVLQLKKVVAVSVRIEQLSERDLSMLDVEGICRRHGHIVGVGTILCLRIMGDRMLFRVIEMAADEPVAWIAMSTLITIGKVNPIVNSIFNNSKDGLSIHTSVAEKIMSSFESQFSCKSMVLCGGAGVGKTFLASQIAASFSGHVIRKSGAEFLQNPTILSIEFTLGSNLVILDDADILFSQASKDLQRSIAENKLGELLENSSNCYFLVVVQDFSMIPSRMRRSGRLEHHVVIPIPSREQRLSLIDYLCPQQFLLRKVEILQLTSGFTPKDVCKFLREIELSDELSWLAVSQLVKSTRELEFDIFVPRVFWKDIIGHNKIKKDMQHLVYQWLNTSKLSKLGVKPAMGLIIVGESGKTMLAHAIASNAQLNVIELNAADVFSKYLGESEASIRKVFRQARQIAPCIIFIDNIESIGAKRGLGQGDSGVQERVLSTLLNEMDGITQNVDVFFIATSSNLEFVDAALLRPGRLEIIVNVPPLDLESLIEIAQQIFCKVALGQGVSVESLVSQILHIKPQLSVNQLKRICTNLALSALIDNCDSPIILQKHVDKEMKLFQEITLRLSFRKPLLTASVPFSFEINGFTTGSN